MDTLENRARQMLIASVRTRIETTEECIDNFALPQYVIELLQQDINMQKALLGHLEKGGAL